MFDTATDNVIPLLIGCIYMLSEAVKWLVKGKTQGKKEEDMAVFKAKVIERLDQVKDDLEKDGQHYVDIIFTLKDIAHVLNNISQTQKELGAILKELHKKL